MKKRETDHSNQMKILSVPYIDKNFIPNSTINKRKVDINYYMYNNYDSAVLNNSFYENIYTKYNKLNENMKKKKMSLIDANHQENITKKKDSQIKEKQVENEGNFIKNDMKDKKYQKIKIKQTNKSNNIDENIIVKRKIPVKDTILPRNPIKNRSKILKKNQNIMKIDNLLDNSIKKLMSNSIVKSNSPKKPTLAKLLKNIDENLNNEEVKDNNNIFSLSKERLVSLKSNSDVNEKIKNKRKKIFCCF